jgi:hypothetical protein
MRRGQHKPRYTLEWERERVKRWMEIVMDDPMTRHRAERGWNQAKHKAEFEERYAQLEAEVPTP